ncbi:MAG: dethiobiotin synthase [Chitinophagales bacterium]
MKTQFPKQIFVSGIDTGIGKTISAAVLTEALHADYWKPIQSGIDEVSDSETVNLLISNTETRVHKEAYVLKNPSSPHYSARMEGVNIDLALCKLPTDRKLIVEGAGGLMVPLTEKFLQLDLIRFLELPVVLVVKNYLGSINHTLLTIEVLRSKGITVTGLIFNGPPFNDNEEIILKFYKLPVLGHIDVVDKPSKDFVIQQAAKLRVSLLEHFQL